MVLFQMVISVLDMYSPKFSVTFITVIVSVKYQKLGN